MNLTFAERSPVAIGAVSAVLIVLGTVGALVVQGGLFRGGYTVTAEFADAAGLRPGDQVVIAGIRAGEVTDMRLAGDRVEADLRVDDYEMPKTTRGSVILRTIVGRRSVELIATGDWGELLEDGDRIPLAQTEVLVDVPEFGEVAGELFDETDTDALNTFLSALTDVLRGQRAQVESLIQGGSRLTGIVNDQEEEVRTLLRRLRTVSEALASRDQQLVGIIDDFGLVVASLAERREDVRRLLRATNSSSAIAADIVAAERASLDSLLGDVHVASEVLSRHQLDLAEALAYGGDAIKGFASIAYSGPMPVPWGNVFVTSLGPAGIDAVGGCGGLLDQYLDTLLGPDPRTCDEQENETFPDDVREEEAGPQAAMSASGVPARHGLHVLGWRALAADGADVGAPAPAPPLERPEGRPGP